MDHLSKIFSALADPTRRAILERLMEGGASFTELANPHAISRPAVVKHIKALERAGLVQRTGAASRPVYRLSAAMMKSPRDWLNRYQVFWENPRERSDAFSREASEGDRRRA